MSAPIPLSARAAVVAVCTALAVALMPAGVANAADDDASWTVRTASNDFGAERTSYSYTVNPGSSVTDAMTVANHGSAALDLGVYAADGFTTDAGELDLLVGGAENANIGAWVETDSSRLVIAPGETVDVPFSLTVPENATPGDYAGGIVTSLAQPDDTSTITVDRRLGIRIALRVAGDLVPGLTVDDARIDWDGAFFPFAGGTGAVSYTVRNTGNAVVSARQSATVAGPFGWWPVAAAAIEDSPQLLPGESRDVTVAAPGVPPLLWLTGSVVVTAVVTDASGSTTTLEPIRAAANGWAVPWLLLLLLVALVALIIRVPRARRRRRARAQELEDARVREAVESALRGTGEVPATVGQSSGHHTP